MDWRKLLPNRKTAKQDGIAGLISGIANLPGEMASGVLAGVNPILAINTLIVGMPIAGMISSTRSMMFDTTGAMILVAADGLADRQGDDRAQAMIVIALTAGIFQIVLGMLGLGQLTKFVSNAVMTGFLSGVAVMIILGQLWDLTGFVGEGGSKLEKTWQLVTNLNDINIPTTVVGLGSLIVMIIFQHTRLKTFNLLIGLALAMLAAWIFRLFDTDSIALVKDLGAIPRQIPSFDLPEFRLVPKLILAGVAVGSVGLIQAPASPSNIRILAGKSPMIHAIFWPRALATPSPASSVACRGAARFPARRSMSPPAPKLAGRSSFKGSWRWRWCSSSVICSG